MAKCVDFPYFVWRMGNFASASEQVSPALFSMGLKWQLRFSRFVDDGVEKIRLILECLSASEALSTLEFKAEVHFVYDDGSRTALKSSKYSLKDKEWCVWTDSVNTFQNNYKNILGRIAFSLTITPRGLEKLFKNKEVEETNCESLCLTSLIEDFGKLFNNDEHSDFILKCGERKFFVHKAVLSARSEYFAGMFRSNMKEIIEGTGEIENLEADTLELILRYLYTGEIPICSTESLQSAYAAADRLAVEPLKVKCCSLFVDNLTSGSEGEAEKQTENKPLNRNEQTEDVMPVSEKENQLLKQLFLSREWRSFAEEFPHKAQEMCRPFLFQK